MHYVSFVRHVTVLLHFFAGQNVGPIFKLCCHVFISAKGLKLYKSSVVKSWLSLLTTFHVLLLSYVPVFDWQWDIPVVMSVICRSQWPRGLKDVVLRPLACWNCGFESRRGHGRLSVVSVVFCQVEASALGWSFVQRSPTECGVSCVYLETSIMRRLWPTGGGGARVLRHVKKKSVICLVISCRTAWLLKDRLSGNVGK
jgi:hypothetical protein